MLALIIVGTIAVIIACTTPAPVRAEPSECSNRAPVPISVDFSTTGPAVPCDGDELIIGGRDYRLNGIDAFETKQKCGDVACGKEATNALGALVVGKQVKCTDIRKRHSNRIIARCTIGSNRIEDSMVSAGWAFVRFDYACELEGTETCENQQRLCKLEREAARTKTGMWALEWSAADLPYFKGKGGTTKTIDEISCKHEFRRQ